MKVKCICGKEETGRVHNLQKRWVICFISNDVRVERCEECKPLLWDRRENFKIFETDIDREIDEKMTRLKIINKL